MGQTVPTLNSEHGSSESVLGQIGNTVSHPGEHKVFPSFRSPSGLRKSMLDAICESGNSRGLKNPGQGACSRWSTGFRRDISGTRGRVHKNLGLAWSLLCPSTGIVYAL